MANKFYELLQEMNNLLKEKGFRKEVMNVDELSNYTGFSASYIYRLTSQSVGFPKVRPL